MNQEDIIRSRDHQRNKVKQVKKSRNRIVNGLKYWRERCVAAEEYIRTGGNRVELIPGDVVHIKSGSPKMTIASLTKKRASVVYCAYNTNVVVETTVPLISLERV